MNSYNFWPLIPLFASLVYLGFVWFRVLSDKTKPEEYEPPEKRAEIEEEGYFTDEDSFVVGDQKTHLQLDSRQKSTLVRTAAVVVLLLATSWTLWFLPAEVPDEVVMRAEQQVPSELAVEEVHTESSPLQWRVTYRGRLGDSTQITEVMYTQDRFNGEGQATISMGGLGRSELYIYLTPILIALAVALVWIEMRRYLNKQKEKPAIDF